MSVVVGAIPPEMGNLAKLRRLNLSENKLLPGTSDPTQSRLACLELEALAENCGLVCGHPWVETTGAFKDWMQQQVPRCRVNI